ncbi:MAG: hypothetical protein LBO66_07985 [Deltaproteobacteria bacterium]|jgi:hypothetical protein|nr:hypothetical protein [Deltaproteobacteria bacterium]
MLEPQGMEKYSDLTIEFTAKELLTHIGSNTAREKITVFKPAETEGYWDFCVTDAEGDNNEETCLLMSQVDSNTFKWIYPEMQSLYLTFVRP